MKPLMLGLGVLPRPMVGLFAHHDEVTAVSFSPDGCLLITATRDGGIKIWDAASGKEKASFSHGSAVNVLSISPDGKLLATMGEVGRVRLWNLADAKNLANIEEKVKAMAFTDQGLLLALDSRRTQDERLRLLDRDRDDYLTVALLQGMQLLEIT